VHERAVEQRFEDGVSEPSTPRSTRPTSAGNLSSFARSPVAPKITTALRHLSFGKHIAVLTDARFSGVSTGACIGHIGPEALMGGPIGRVRDGDLIKIVVDRSRLEGSIDLVGEGTTEFGPEQGARSSGPHDWRRPRGSVTYLG